MSENSIITLARLWLVNKKAPYLATALWALSPIETPGLRTIGVDKYYRLYWDPEIVNNWTVPQVATIIYHEICHLLRDHHDRAKGTQERIFNLATDMEINDDIEADSEWQFPCNRAKNINEGGYVTPATIKAKPDQLAEYYYKILMSMAQEQQDQMISGDESSGAGEGNCGSSTREQKQNNEQDQPKDNEPGLTKTEAELVQKKTAEDIQAYGRGELPAAWERWAKDKLTSKTNWRLLLARWIKNAVIMASGAVDYTYMKKGRYNLPGNIIYPSLFEPIPNISVVIDTSGSMSNGQLNQASAEIEKILRSCGVKTGVKIFAVDAAVANEQQLTKISDLKMKGGGGTDMRVGIAAAEAAGSDVTIVLTDGETPWPEAPTKTRVIVGLITRHTYWTNKVPEWMTKVEIKD